MFVGVKELEACVESLAHEQRQVCENVAGSTLSMCRLRQRLAVTYRYFLALGRHSPTDSVKAEPVKQPTVHATKKKYVLCRKFV